MYIDFLEECEGVRNRRIAVVMERAQENKASLYCLTSAHKIDKRVEKVDTWTT